MRLSEEIDIKRPKAVGIKTSSSLMLLTIVVVARVFSLIFEFDRVIQAREFDEQRICYNLRGGNGGRSVCRGETKYLTRGVYNLNTVGVSVTNAFPRVECVNRPALLRVCRYSIHSTAS